MSITVTVSPQPETAVNICPTTGSISVTNTLGSYQSLVYGDGLMSISQGNTVSLNDIVFLTGNQTIAGFKSFTNVPDVSGDYVVLTSALVNKLDVTGVASDSALLDGQEGSYYYPASNHSGYVSSSSSQTLTYGTGLMAISGGNVVALHGVVYNTGDQDISGSKTFKESTCFGSDVLVGTDLLSADYGANMVGVGTASPDTTLHVYNMLGSRLMLLERGNDADVGMGFKNTLR